MDTSELQRLLSEHDDGILRHGAHEEGREFCALEFESRVRGRAWSDAPITLPDLRPLNDARWSSDTARTAALLPVMAALWDWTSWSTERRQAWAERVVIATVNQIISELPSLPDEIRVRCRAATDITAARAAAWASAEAAARAAADAEAWAAAWASADAARAAAEAAAWAAAWAAADAAARAAAWASAWAAREAAEAARAAREAAAADSVLLIACRIWIEAAEATQ